ncbi:Toll-like receptor 4 [Elysia marginata]|uniref:Toll-like receptor 4 n=1 Tax=Elysia marginata TaxID=1093978 RepID=A0AAV4JPC0_9GAST|nr:Toll-like receptor 4 [Elysia marginata]
MHRFEILNLSHNSVITIQTETFHGLRSLNLLSLQYNKLFYVPGTFEREAFQGLVSLESLHLEHNQPKFTDNFVYPDQSLAYLSSLKNFWLDGYPQPLGQGFSSLKNLSYLKFSGTHGFCSMKTMPENFFANVTTQQPLSLEMSFCSISEIPSNFFTFLHTIYSLNLYYNEDLTMDGFERGSKSLENSSLVVLNISQIVRPFVAYSAIGNTTFRYLKNTKLKILHIESCRLVGINPRALLDLPKTIEYVSVRNNYLELFIPLFTTMVLTNLKQLDISQQMHFTVPKRLTFGQTHDSFSKNRNNSETKIIHLASNRVKEKRTTLWSNNLLQSFRITTRTINTIIAGRTFFDCGTSSKGDWISQTKRVIMLVPEKLEVLNASDIKLDFDVPEIHVVNNHVLKTWDISVNDMKCFGGPLYGLPSLQHIDLSRNLCFKLNPLFFSKIPILVTLLLYQNRLGTSLAQDAASRTFSTLQLLET